MKAGETIRFDDLAYGGYAIDSYAVFKRLRDEGVVPEGVRFQMSLPAPHSAIDGFLEDHTQWPALYAAYVEGIRGEIGKALDVIPAGDLVIQWDAAWEFVDMAMGEPQLLQVLAEAPPRRSSSATPSSSTSCGRASRTRRCSATTGATGPGAAGR